MSVEKGVSKDSIILQYYPLISLKYWKTIFKPIKNIFKIPIFFDTNKIEIKNIEWLENWRKNNYPNCKIIFFCNNSFKIGYDLFEGYTHNNISIVKIQTNIKVPYRCNSNKFVDESY